jgi:hypothetical protein
VASKKSASKDHFLVAGLAGDWTTVTLEAMGISTGRFEYIRQVR